MNAETTIILCGGQINYSNLPVATNTSNAMIPVNGKPVIGWILDDLQAKGILRVTVVLREQDHRLQAFLQRAYSNRMDLCVVPLTMEGTIVQSLQTGLRRSPSTGLARVVLGDTLIQDEFCGDQDFVYISEVEDSRRWCLALTDRRGRILDYLDKAPTAPKPHLALAGYYHFCHAETLQRCVDAAVSNGERELSSVLRRYGVVHPITARPVATWYDFGNIDRLVAARQQLLRPRYFNSLTVNPVLGTITKVSEHDDKLRDELDWYLNLPDELKVLAPRIISHQQVDGRLQIVQEYYGYPTLAEIYVYGDLHADTWVSILHRVLAIHTEFRRHPGELPPRFIEEMYVDKTYRRLAEVRRQDKVWERLLAAEAISYNGKELRGLPVLEANLRARANELAHNAPVSIIHGDYCFSNILFDLNNQIMRLVDPRGRFGPRGIYGDARYDMAKLRHSVHEYYDYILADMYELNETAGGFEGQVFANGMPQVVGASFDVLLAEWGYNLDEVRFIEALLFISMLPIHQGNLHRQQMMFLTGLSLLNEVL